MNKRGQELWGQIKWPVNAVVIADLDSGKAQAIQVMDASGLLMLFKTSNAGEAKDLAALLNWLNEDNRNQEMQLSEKNMLIGDLSEIKIKYYELLKKYEQLLIEKHPLKVVDPRDVKPATDKSPADQMIKQTMTEEYKEDSTYRPEQGGRAVRAAESDVKFAADPLDSRN